MNTEKQRAWEINFLSRPNVTTDVTREEIEHLTYCYNFLPNMEEEYAGNFILTKDLGKYEDHCKDMCCGIVTRTFKIGDVEIYYAMDYGH
tara:strand:- start:338 stop:607 length:270 start_codon:yes stop_codon:yes gene_type:complete